MSTSPSDHPPHPPTRSIPPSEPRKRAIVAGICATIFGAFVISGIIRSCEGEDIWKDAKQKQAEPSQ